MKMNKFAAEVHQNAVEHGWWDEERSFGEIIALCHSELSEALEEYRAKRPMLYFPCNSGGLCVDDRPLENMTCGSRARKASDPETFCSARSNKPEGIAVELADCIIRILDWYGKDGMDTDALLEDVRKHRSGYTRHPLVDAILQNGILRRVCFRPAWTPLQCSVPGLRDLRQTLGKSAPCPGRGLHHQVGRGQRRGHGENSGHQA